MAVTYAPALKDTRMGSVVTAIGATGYLVIGTSSLSGATGVIVKLPLSATAGTVLAGVLTLNPVTATAATADGTAAKAEIRSSNADTGNVVVSDLTVGTALSNINLSAVVISTGTTVTISSGTITHG
jgi:hypothetical protein